MNVYSGEKLGTVVTGSICGGQLYVGGHVNVHCMGRKVSESAIDATEMFHKLLDHAEKGDVVGLSLLGLPANGVSVGCTVVTLGKMVSSMFIEGEFTLRQHRANGLLSRKSIPTMNHDRDTPLKCLHVRTDSSRQTWSVSQNQIRKCE